jgi:hypothetical protein
MTRPDVGHAWSDGMAEPVFRTLEILANRAVVNEFVNETRRNGRVMSRVIGDSWPRPSAGVDGMAGDEVNDPPRRESHPRVMPSQPDRRTPIGGASQPNRLHANRSGTLNESLSSLAASGFIPP